MSKIQTAEVERIARLARISLNADETEQMATELGHIISFVEQLQSVDVSQTEPTDQVTGLEDVCRADEVVPSLSRDALLANAPAQKDGYLVVKRVLNG